MRRFFFAVLVASLTACASPEPAARPHAEVAPEPAHAGPSTVTAGVYAAPTPVAPAAPVAGDAVRRYGAPIGTDVAAVHLGQVLQAPSQFENRPLRVEGTVAAVCQEMGCWMEIRDEATQAHVRMHGHSFFLPRDVSGHRAAVQATLVAAHPATGCDREAQAATGRVAQVELDATGVEIYN